MIPKLKATRGGPFMYNGEKGEAFGIIAPGWIVPVDPELMAHEDPRLIARGVVAAMLIHVGKQMGVNLCLGKSDDVDDAPPTLEAERAMMDLLAKAKAK